MQQQHNNNGGGGAVGVVEDNLMMMMMAQQFMQQQQQHSNNHSNNNNSNDLMLQQMMMEQQQQQQQYHHHQQQLDFTKESFNSNNNQYQSLLFHQNSPASPISTSSITTGNATINSSLSPSPLLNSMELSHQQQQQALFQAQLHAASMTSPGLDTHQYQQQQQQNFDLDNLNMLSFSSTAGSPEMPKLDTTTINLLNQQFLNTQFTRSTSTGASSSGPGSVLGDESASSDCASSVFGLDCGNGTATASDSGYESFAGFSSVPSEGESSSLFGGWTGGVGVEVGLKRTVHRSPLTSSGASTVSSGSRSSGSVVYTHPMVSSQPMNMNGIGMNMQGMAMNGNVNVKMEQMLASPPQQHFVHPVVHAGSPNNIVPAATTSLEENKSKRAQALALAKAQAAMRVRQQQQQQLLAQQQQQQQQAQVQQVQPVQQTVPTLSLTNLQGQSPAQLMALQQQLLLQQQAIQHQLAQVEILKRLELMQQQQQQQQQQLQQPVPPIRTNSTPLQIQDFTINNDLFLLDNSLSMSPPSNAVTMPMTEMLSPQEQAQLMAQWQMGQNVATSPTLVNMQNNVNGKVNGSVVQGQVSTQQQQQVKPSVVAPATAATTTATVPPQSSTTGGRVSPTNNTTSGLGLSRAFFGNAMAKVKSTLTRRNSKDGNNGGLPRRRHSRNSKSEMEIDDDNEYDLEFDGDYDEHEYASDEDYDMEYDDEEEEVEQGQQGQGHFIDASLNLMLPGNSSPTSHMPRKRSFGTSNKGNGNQSGDENSNVAEQPQPQQQQRSSSPVLFPTSKVLVPPLSTTLPSTTTSTTKTRKSKKSQNSAMSALISSSIEVTVNKETGEEVVIHKCPEVGCNKTFSRPHNLKSHLNTHTDEKPFSCDHCELSFRRNHDLKRHVRLHTNDRPYVCSHCTRAFARSDALSRHLKVDNCMGNNSVNAGTVTSAVTGIAVQGDHVFPSANGMLLAKAI
ncbi:hypothetical protein HDU76_000913 [Blyttiomyces sp. JEL0837]|nr:hypothetical protein HDU76_000913 [Blyttiomyces sp. JEL0837]